MGLLIRNQYVNRELEIKMLRVRSFLTVTGLCLLGFMVTSQVVAQDKAEGKSKDTTDEKALSPAEELLKVIQDRSRQRPRTVQQLREFQGAIRQAADKLLEIKDIDDSVALTAIQAKFRALTALGKYGDKAALIEAVKFAESLTDDSREKIAKLAASQLLAAKAANIAQLKEEEQLKLIEDLAAALADGHEQSVFSACMAAARGLERGNTEVAANAYRTFAKVLESAQDPRLKRYGPKLAGSALRITLPGNKMEIEGQTASEETFDWESYRGKVVLVDFWASWCGPCVAELPNVKKNYENYHERGFEVVGINLDTSKAKLDKFVTDRDIPWTNLFCTEKTTQGWDHPMATKFGVLSIPTAILVDKEGKVVSLRARGPVLTKALEKLLGPVDATSDATETGSE
ncbi:MAG TPA: TlpA family protein disulfide reductase [Planctomycetes bacterium]|nr:TlpA family protein disulfide reductase [Planctomycetota bacterium]